MSYSRSSVERRELLHAIIIKVRDIDVSLGIDRWPGEPLKLPLPFSPRTKRCYENPGWSEFLEPMSISDVYVSQGVYS
jgi:hypothetical protein